MVMTSAVSRQKKGAGFTLVELMIAVAVMAILTAIAYPMYQEQVQKSRRSAVKGSMLQLSQFMERNFTETMNYNTDPNGNTLNNINDVFNLTAASSYLEDRNAVEQYYNLSLSTTATAYTISAAPKSGQSNDKCGTLGITSTGNKTTTSNYTCW